MAEPIGDSAGLDSRLRDAFAKAAEQGDSTGVADAIRSRVAAGDSGTSIASSTAPGWGGGVGSWLPWIGLIVVAAVGGTAVGASGLTGAPVGAPELGPTAVVVGTAPAASCPGGPVIDELHSGDRVLAVERSEESDYFGVRDPRDLDRVLWLPASVLTIDPGQPDPTTLPIGECPAVAITYVTPTPTPEPEPVDTTRPTITQVATSNDPVFGPNGGTATISAGATDDTRVIGVAISWSGAVSGSGQMTWNGSAWTFLFDPENGPTGTVTFTLQARDAAGNVSTPATLTVKVS